MDWSSIGQVALRGVGSLAALFVLTRLMGRKQVAQLTFFDYIIGISIGSIAAEVTANADTPFWNGLTGMAVYALAALGISVLTSKSIWARRCFTGSPVLLIQHGKLDERAMARVHYDVNDLVSACRTMGAFAIDEIEFAILEPNGQLSVLKKAEQLPATPKDLGLAVEKSVLSGNVIIDGQIMQNNLRGLGRDEQWLRRQLDAQHAAAHEVLLAQCDENGRLTVYLRDAVGRPMKIME